MKREFKYYWEFRDYIAWRRDHRDSSILHILVAMNMIFEICEDLIDRNRFIIYGKDLGHVLLEVNGVPFAIELDDLSYDNLKEKIRKVIERNGNTDNYMRHCYVDSWADVSTGTGF